MTASTQDKDALLREQIALLKECRDVLQCHARHETKELRKRMVKQRDCITAALSEQANGKPIPPIPTSLPEPVATPRTDVWRIEDHHATVGGELYDGLIDSHEKLEHELLAERERAEKLVREWHPPHVMEVGARLFQREKQRAEQAESRLSAAVALLREHGITFE